MVRVLKKNLYLSIINGLIVDLPTPSNLSSIWNMGSLLGVILVSQVISGVLCSIHYVPTVHLAFASIEHLIRDVNSGWILRYLHANGASFFFIIMYIHVGRSIYYSSYMQPRVILWILGVALLIISIGVAFLGYVLPWGQISFWGATVITFVGGDAVRWLWGGFSVDNPTLSRFYSLHFLLPFVLIALVVLHVVALHSTGSSNPTGLTSASDRVTFHPFYTTKDLVGFIVIFTFLAAVISYMPDALGHIDNYTEANPLITPSHIQPEWYFLPYYVVLRAIPNKLLGVLGIAGSIVILVLIPWLLTSVVRGSSSNIISQVSMWVFFANFALLIWLGAQSPESPYDILAQISTLLYFSWFIVVTPVIGVIESFALKINSNT